MFNQTNLFPWRLKAVELNKSVGIDHERDLSEEPATVPNMCIIMRLSGECLLIIREYRSTFLPKLDLWESKKSV